MDLRAISEADRLRKYVQILKKANMYCPDKGMDSGPFEGTGSYVLGPAVNAFVLWVLKHAVQSGIKRLYFLARDGYFMYHTAEIYRKKLGLSLECKYIACSRYALRIPTYHLNVQDALEYICRAGVGLTISRVLDRAGLSVEQKKTVLEQLDVEGEADEVIPYAELERLKERLLNCSVFVDMMLRQSRAALPNLVGYLRQEGFLDGAEDAIVDSGWVGSMQKTLNQILYSMGRRRRLTGYYWGLYELPDNVERQEYHCYYFSPEGQIREKVGFNNNVFEAVFSAPHGMTIGYKKIDGKFVPVIDSLSDERKAYMKQMEGVLMSYVDRASERVMDLESIDSAREKKTLAKMLRLFMTRPSKAEAEIYGGLIFCDDVLEYGNRQLAERMSEHDLTSNHAMNKILVMLGIRKGHVKESAWYEGSVIRCGTKKRRYHLMQYRVYRYMLFMRQMYIWKKRCFRRQNGSRQRGYVAVSGK